MSRSRLPRVLRRPQKITCWELWLLAGRRAPALACVLRRVSQAVFVSSRRIDEALGSPAFLRPDTTACADRRLTRHPRARRRRGVTAALRTIRYEPLVAKTAFYGPRTVARVAAPPRAGVAPKQTDADAAPPPPRPKQQPDAVSPRPKQQPDAVSPQARRAATGRAMSRLDRATSSPPPMEAPSAEPALPDMPTAAPETAPPAAPPSPARTPTKYPAMMQSGGARPRPRFFLEGRASRPG